MLARLVTLLKNEIQSALANSLYQTFGTNDWVHQVEEKKKMEFSI